MEENQSRAILSDESLHAAFFFGTVVAEYVHDVPSGQTQSRSWQMLDVALRVARGELTLVPGSYELTIVDARKCSLRAGHTYRATRDARREQRHTALALLQEIQGLTKKCMEMQRLSPQEQ